MAESGNDRRRTEAELRTAVKRLQAATDVALAVGGQTELGGVLQAIVERGRALVDARALVVLLQEGDELTVAATSGQLDAELDGARFPSPARVRELLRARSGAQRLEGPAGSGPTLLAPLVFRGQQLGVVVALDRLGQARDFDHEDARLLEAFAASAATAVATAQSMAEDRLSNTIQAAEQERGRWARELHDETLQGLAALRVSLAAALNQRSSEALERAGREAIDQIESEIQKLRSMITELRPAALDEIGLEAALRALAERSAEQGGISIETRIELPPDDPRGRRVLDTTVYRLVQEALNNAVRHSEASRVLVAVRQSDGRLDLVIEDDGVGFEPDLLSGGFGIRGMRERVTLAGGELRIDSAPGRGTRVSATLRVPDPADERRRAVRRRSSPGAGD